jgi:hypothetical protein
MNKKEKLIKKIERLWRQANLPEYLHRYGPKKFQSVFLAFCWFITQEYTRSYRRTQQYLMDNGFLVPHWTTIQKAVSRFTARVWSLLHRMSALVREPYIAAVDSTYFSLTNPSAHYLNRISQTYVSCPAKASVLVDTRTGISLACRFRARPAHDARDVPYLLRHATKLPKKLVADSAYDAEQNVFEPCHDRNIIAVVKPRKGWKEGFYRHKMRKHFDLRTYHRRPTVEGYFSRLKQRFGGNLRCRTARTQRAEVYARIILQNLSSFFQNFFYSALFRRCGSTGPRAYNTISRCQNACTDSAAFSR